MEFVTHPSRLSAFRREWLYHKQSNETTMKQPPANATGFSRIWIGFAFQRLIMLGMP
ncbi:uncharacterized protein LACBIDRAFT_310454 [Laccaria bicolor S238N-H82]|uniref:Predicted protein n=1 Tax=Laccaria bicolor (strain S238N-H82 / ATCC MYA-4686) TaxID=486041 RepID=B0DUD6_LACBS|nr:uncharacterized protein LACBIDRAFT_310454 [Laccaria bicolor S238N-H82]EDR01724.1 predicted protein [Laccaria bicolor S238N-H82]|eukprot:XP_001887537.1 predicted protein [Laccaria bicolor S238N-H82]